MRKSKRILTGFLIFLLASSVAWGSSNSSGYKLSIYAGWQEATLTPSNFDLIGNETQVLAPNKKRVNNFTGGLGAAYRFLITDHQRWLRFTHDITLGLDVFYFETNQTGIVWAFGELPDFSYHLKIKSTRFLANVEWTFLPVLIKLFPFFQFGLGFALNANSYNDIPLVSNGVGLTFKDNSVIQFAYDLGAGIKWMPSKYWEMSLRYLYSDLGLVNSGRVANLPVATSYTIPLKTQAVLLGLAYFL